MCVDAEQGTGEGEYLTEGGEDSGVYHSCGRDEERHGDERHAEEHHRHRHNLLYLLQ